MKKGKRQAVQEHGHLTLSHFADATGSKATKATRVTKALKSGKFLLDFDSQNEAENEEETDEIDEEQQSFSLKKKQTKNTKIDKERTDEGIVYPYDLFEILSMHIAPESVATFSSLCRSAYASICRVRFWLNLYEKYARRPSLMANQISGCELLPERYREDYVNRHCHGNLRISVIRSLFYTHPPFRSRLSCLQMKPDPHSVVGSICLGAWWTSRKVHSFYRFCFKVSQKPHLTFKTNAADKNEDPESWDSDVNIQADISVSPIESCNLLIFDCDAFSILPAVTGLRIHDLNVTSSGDGFRYQKVNLTMGPPHIRCGKNGRVQATSPNSIVVSIGNITSIHLLNFYHPMYQNS